MCEQCQYFAMYIFKHADGDKQESGIRALLLTIRRRLDRIYKAVN